MEQQKQNNQEEQEPVQNDDTKDKKYLDILKIFNFIHLANVYIHKKFRQIINEEKMPKTSVNI